MTILHDVAAAAYIVTVHPVGVRRVTYDRSGGTVAKREAYQFALEMEADMEARANEALLEAQHATLERVLADLADDDAFEAEQRNARRTYRAELRAAGLLADAASYINGAADLLSGHGALYADAATVHVNADGTYRLYAAHQRETYHSVKAAARRFVGIVGSDFRLSRD